VDLLRHVATLEAAVRGEPLLGRETRVVRVRDGLRARNGDASLARAALMTPQELLDLPGVGRASLDLLVGELSALHPLSVPELIMGRGKTELQSGHQAAGAVLEFMRGLQGEATSDVSLCN
jgi:hypothetical protein